MLLVGLLSTLGAVSLAEAAAIERRAPTYPGTCPALSSLVSSSSSTTAANAFCVQFLGITPKTITSTTTLTKFATQTGTVYTTATRIVTPADAQSTVLTTTTGRVTTTPGAVTSTATVTSTAYLDNDGNTITLMKRTLPTAIEKRGVATPAVFSGWARASVTSACNCLHPATPTVTRTAVATTTSTVNAALSRTIKATTTLPTVTGVATVVTQKTQTLVAPAPIVTGSAVEIDTVDGCPPDTTSTFLCPQDTGDDDGSLSDQDQIACSVDTSDDFYGYCAYWDDDGSPAGSTLVQDDPAHVGDPAYQTTRAASYGDADTDDCPTWADWTCAPSAAPGGSRFRRDVLDLNGANPAVRRALDLEPRKPKTTSVKKAKATKKVSKPTATKKAASTKAASTKAASTKAASTKKATSTSSSQPKSNGKHTFSSLFDRKDPPKRGGSYVPWSKASAAVKSS